MSDNRICHVPKKGIDDVIASKMGSGFTPFRVANLRGIYDTRHPNNPLDVSNLDVAAQKLAAFNRADILVRAKEIKETSTHLSESYKRLKEQFSAEEQFDRINMISYMFSQRLSAMQNGTPGVTRTQIANSYIDSEGIIRGGEIRIFEGVYHDLLDAYEAYTEDGDTESALKIQKVLDNWAALVTFARIRLRDTEGLILGAHSAFSTDVDPSNYIDEDLSEIFDLSESKREAWQEVAAAISSFGSLSKDVRRFLSSIPVIEDGKQATDDLGIPKMLDPVKIHQALQEVLRGCTSRNSMMRRLKARAENAEWIRPIIEALDTFNGQPIPAYRDWASLPETTRALFNNLDQMKTKLFVDLRKNFQPYSIIIKEIKNGIETFKTKILNTPKSDEALKKYMTRATLGTPTSEGAIYGKGGTIHWDRISTLRQLIQEALPAPIDRSKPGNAFASVSGFVRMTKPLKIDFIVKVADLLDIKMTPDAAERLLYNRRDLNKFLKALSDFNYKILNTLLKGESSIPVQRYSDLISTPVGQGQKAVTLKDRLRTLTSISSQYTEGSRMERACRYNGSRKRGTTYYSDVNPSYLGDEIDAIQEYVTAEDPEGLKKYIEGKYLGSSYFMDNGRILNWWLRDLYTEGVDESSFAANFTSPDRLLGEDGNEFENFTSQAHAQALLTKYFAARQLARGSEDKWKQDYAEYPVFILGDSGVAKFIKAKRYDSYTSTDTLLDGLYDVYRQERRRMALVEATAKKMNPWAVRKDGTLDWSKVTVKVENFTNNHDKFSFLPFLNSDYKDVNGKRVDKYARMLSENPTESEVKEAIKAYMEDSLQEFINRLVQYGVATRTTDAQGRTTYSCPTVAQEMAATNSSFTEVIRDYFWNTKFATIQQLQMFTIDPSYYAGTKDLQKRYKEIHAPGIKLDVDARWNGELVAGENPIERAVYFDDIKVNAEDVDTEFMDAILYNFATADRKAVEEAISRKITTPREDAKEEANRISELKSLLGENYSIYDTYRANTLTDGQGYRSLQSYRKVMIMAGKWNDTMESLYNQIQTIRAKYGKDQEIPEEVLAKLSQLAVVFMPIKPYMFTFENYAINDQDKVLIPVQHKYAEAILIPELLPRGSKLRDIAYWMEEHTDETGQSAPIDLICSTKVVKVGNFGSTDISKVEEGKSLIDALNDGYVHQLSYSDYRIQTNVPEHINGSQLFGTQLRKLIMANIGMNSDYSRYTGGRVPRLFRSDKIKSGILNGRNLIQFYNALITANIVDSFGVFDSSVGDATKLSEALLQSTIANSRESLDNMLAYSIDPSGDFLIPLYEGGIEHDSSSLIFSMFRKLVNKQKINGGSAVQVSAMGIKGYAKDGDLRYVTDPNNPENILYAETEIPFDLSYIDENGQTVDLVYEDWVNEDGTLKTDENGNTLIEKRFPGILNLIAYRIPTERDYSMINLRVKRFSRKEAGGTIKVPPQGTSISGFDFDIDKLYFMRRQYRERARYSQEAFSQDELNLIFAEIYEDHPEIKALLEELRDRSDDKKPLNKYWDQMMAENPSFAEDPEYDKDELFSDAVDYLIEEGTLKGREIKRETFLDTYDFNKTPLQNSKTARNNMLIDLIQQRLQDPETFKQRYTPGGFANASTAARIMRELLFGDLSSIGRDGKVTLSSLEDKAKDKASDPEPNYDPSDPLTIITYNQQNQVAGKLIGIFANQNTNHAFASLMSKMRVKPAMAFSLCGHSYDDFLHGPEGIDVDRNVAEFLAASVDAVKDPVLNFLNLNTLTADIGATLARLGYTTEEIGLLLNQPIIKQVCDYAFNNNCQLDTAIRNIVEGYKQGYKIADVTVNETEDFTAQKFIDGIVSARDKQQKGENLSREEVLQQLKVVELFSKISTVARDLSEFVTTTKFTASNAAGSTFGDYYAQQLKVQDYLKRIRESDETTGLSIDMEVAPTMSSPVENDSRFLTMDKEDYVEALMASPFAYEQAMFDMNRKALRALSKYYPYDTQVYKKMRERMNDLVSFGHLDAATINTLHSDVMVYMLGQRENSIFNGEGTFILGEDESGKRITTTNREYYQKIFPQDLFLFKQEHPELAELPILKYLEFPTSEDGVVSLNIENIGGLQSYQKDELRDSWAELMKEYPEIATGLFMYNFYKLGFTFSPKAFMNIAPTEVKEALMVGDVSYVDFLKAVRAGQIGLNVENFARQFILNHTENKRLVFTPFKEQLTTISRLAKDAKGRFKPEFILDVSNFQEESGSYLISDSSLPKDSKLFAFKPVIAIKYTDPLTKEQAIAYYVAQTEDSGGTGKFNVSTDKTMRYVYAPELGVTNVSLKYTSGAERQSSAAQPTEVAMQDGRNDVQPEVTKEIVAATDEELLSELASAYAKGYAKAGLTDEQGEFYSEAAIKQLFMDTYDRQALENEIARIRQACKENGVLVLDKDGNLTFGC